MGRKFRVPKQADQREWDKVERLRLAGYFFGSAQSAGSDGSGISVEPFPDDLSEVDDWIARNPRHLKREKSFWTGRIEPKRPPR